MEDPAQTLRPDQTTANYKLQLSFVSKQITLMHSNMRLSWTLDFSIKGQPETQDYICAVWVWDVCVKYIAYEQPIRLKITSGQ